jgi:hypothetical protein
MEKKEVIQHIMGFVRGIKPIDSRLPVYDIDEAGNLIPTGEFMAFAPIKGGMIVRYPLSEEDKKDIFNIENGIRNDQYCKYQ